MQTPLRVFIVLGIAIMAIIAGLAMRGSFSQPVREEQKAAAPEEVSGDVVQKALELAQPDSVLIKTRWVDEIPDLELASLSESSREVFLRIANGRSCTCGCGYTLAACRRFDNQCPVSGPRAKALFDSVKAGQIRSADGFRDREPS